MINRKPLDCDACATRVIVRTQIGHADEQVQPSAYSIAEKEYP